MVTLVAHGPVVWKLNKKSKSENYVLAIYWFNLGMNIVLDQFRNWKILKDSVMEKQFIFRVTELFLTELERFAFSFGTSR